MKKEAFTITKIQTFKHEPFLGGFERGGGGGGGGGISGTLQFM